MATNTPIQYTPYDKQMYAMQLDAKRIEALLKALDTADKLEDISQTTLKDLSAVIRAVKEWNVTDDNLTVKEQLFNIYMKTIEEIAKQSQFKPEFAGSIEELQEDGDKNKLYVLPDGYAYSYMKTTYLPYTNQLPLATDTNGDVFNGIGYTTEYRLNSAGILVSYSGRITTGFIPATKGDVVYCKSLKWAAVIDSIYVCTYDSNKNFISSINGENMTASIDEENKLVTFDLSGLSDNTAYIRISFYSNDTDWDYTQGIITVNEEITEPIEGLAWANTGYKFISLENIDGEISVNANVEFVNTIEDCIDTSKLYVLPDGYIYAYGEANLPLFTDVVRTSQSAGSTEPYNGTGYQFGKYISSIGGVEGDKIGRTVTGYIPISLEGLTEKAEPVFYVKGAKPERIGAYQIDDKSYITLFYANTVYTLEELDSDYYKVTPILKDNGQNAFYYNTAKKELFFRFSLATQEDKGLIISINEPIEYQLNKTWLNTGHAFISSASDERIALLEETTAVHEERISTIENSLEDVVPEYIATEAERVANLVQDNRNAQSLVFAACSDFHLAYSANTKQASLHTGMGIKEIRKYAPLDFIALFGDYVTGGSTSTIAGSKEELKYIHKCMYDAGNGIQQIWMQGNHDRNPYETDDGDLTTDELYSYIGANNTGMVIDYDNPERIYGYKDFEQQKIRVIYLNSSDTTGATTVSDHMFSATQLNWLINTALNFDDKDNPTDWGIVVMSHMPLNWTATPLNIIDAYISKGTVDFTNDGTRIYHDFTNTVCAEVICLINGHTHNFRMSQIGTNNTWQIAVPQVCDGRYNEYGTSWAAVGGELDENGNPVYWYKTPNSATSTSFVVFVIDRKNKKISAFHYGAGKDRVINLEEENSSAV